MSKGRPPLPLGAWGEVWTDRTATGWRARTRFRDLDGVTRMVERRGRTRGAARNALTQYLTERSAPQDSDLMAATTIEQAVGVWHAENADRWAHNTARRYNDMISLHIIPRIGQMRLREATVPRLDRFVKAIAADVGAPTAKLCTSVLSGTLSLAARHGAIDTNPMRDVGRVRVTHRAPTALTVEQVRALRDAARRHEAVGGARRVGRPRHPGIAAIIDTLLGTGARIGEVLALRWSDVDLEAGTVTISGTVIATGTGMGRQERTKTDTSRRTLQLPPFAVAALLRHRVESETTTDGDWCFPSAAGTVRDPNNVRKTWRKLVADAGLPDGTTPHAIRRTVATIIDRDADTRNAASQLGHASTTVTERHYVERAHLGPDVRDVLDQLGA